MVLLAVPATAAADVLAAAGPLDGKVLIDATNNLSGGPDGAAIAALATGAHTVKAFNTVFAQFFADPPASPPTLVFAGDDAGREGNRRRPDPRRPASIRSTPATTPRRPIWRRSPGS